MIDLVPVSQELFTYFAEGLAVFGLLALIVKREKIFEAMKRCKDEFITNLGLMLINGLFLVPLFIIPQSLVQAAIGAPQFLVDLWPQMGFFVTILMAVLVFEFVAYWRHRWEHTPFLWRIHATHHADTQMHWLSVNRKHPLGKLFAEVLDIVLVLALGFPVWAIILASLIRSWWGLFIHADLPWTLGPLGNWLISPAAHRLHHIRDEKLMGANYGNMVTIWDRMFGTYVDPAPYLNCETGIEEGTRGLLGELARPWEAIYRKKSAAKEEIAA